MRFTVADVLEVAGAFRGFFKGRKARKILREMEMAGVEYHRFREAKDEIMAANSAGRGSALTLDQTKAVAYLFRRLGA